MSYVFVPTTWDPANKGSAVTLSNGNLTSTGVQANGISVSVASLSSGKCYWELSSPSTHIPNIGVSNASPPPFGYGGIGEWVYSAYNWAKYHNGSGAGYGGYAWVTTDIVGVALDADAGSIEIFRNGSSLGVMYTGMTGPYFAFVGAATSDSASITANFGATAFAYTPPTGYSALLGSMVLAADPITGNAELTCPSAVIAFFGGASAQLGAPSAVVVGHGGGSFSADSPPPRLMAFGGASAALSPPPPTLTARGHDSTGERAANLTAPSPILSANGGANSTLKAPSPTLVVTVTVTGWGHAEATAPKPTLSASGTVTMPGSAALTAPSPNLIGYGGAVCSVTLSNGPTLQASGITGAVGGAALTCPLFELTTSGTAQGYGFANLLAPAGHLGATARAWLTASSPMLTATGHAVVAATYEAYAINLNHAPGDQEPVDEVTHYTNFPFNGIVRYQSSYYGWGADGLYLLEGTMDDANEIQYVVRTCIDDFKLTNKKNVVSAYFAGRIGPDMTVTLYAGEDGQASYDYHTANGPQARTHREKFARGVTDRYFAIGVSGNGALELADIELEINKLKRKT